MLVACIYPTVISASLQNKKKSGVDSCGRICAHLCVNNVDRNAYAKGLAQIAFRGANDKQLPLGTLVHINSFSGDYV